MKQQQFHFRTHCTLFYYQNIASILQIVPFLKDHVHLEKSEKLHQKLLNCFTNYEKLLLNYLMLIRLLYLRLNTNIFMEKEFEVCQQAQLAFTQLTSPSLRSLTIEISKYYQQPLAQVDSRNPFKNLLNEIRQIMYPLHRAKQITKNVCSNIMNSISL